MNNPVAKFAHCANKSATFKDKKKDYSRKVKHKKVLDTNI